MPYYSRRKRLTISGLSAVKHDQRLCKYDRDGQVKTLYVPSSPYNFAFGYDATNRLEKIYGEVPARPLHYQYFYDLAGNVSERRNYLNPATQTYGYDARNRIGERVINAMAYDSTNTLALYEYSHEYYNYDALSRLSLTDRRLRWARDGAVERTLDAFAYNDAGELTNVQYGITLNGQGQWSGPMRTVSYNLDNAGNRDGTAGVNENGMFMPYNPNVLNQYSQTANGSEHEVAAYNSVSYRYIADQRLARVSSASAGTYELGYDALGRCVRRTTNGVTKYSAYDGERPILDYDGNGTITNTRLYGRGIDELIAHGNNGSGQFYHQDRLGNVSAITDFSGQVIEQYRYDAFGQPEIRSGPVSGNPNGTVQTGTLINNRFLFTGREWAARYGFYEYRNRAYNPALGRFMSEDPKGFAAGDRNLFRYCAGDPVNKTDPMGLYSDVIGGAGDTRPNNLTSTGGGDWNWFNGRVALEQMQQQQPAGNTSAARNQLGGASGATEKGAAPSGSSSGAATITRSEQNGTWVEKVIRDNKVVAYIVHMKWTYTVKDQSGKGVPNVMVREQIQYVNPENFNPTVLQRGDFPTRSNGTVTDQWDTPFRAATGQVTVRQTITVGGRSTTWDGTIGVRNGDYEVLSPTQYYSEFK